MHWYIASIKFWHHDINAWQNETKKTAVHIGFVNIFCTAAVHGDTSKKKKFRYKTEINKNLANHQC